MSLQVAFRSLEKLGETAPSRSEKVKLRSADGKTEELDIQGVCARAGAILANTGLKSDSSGCIQVDIGMRTNLPGVYTRARVTCGRKFQIAVSVGQGVTAALSMIRSQAEARRSQKS